MDRTPRVISGKLLHIKLGLESLNKGELHQTAAGALLTTITTITTTIRSVIRAPAAVGHARVSWSSGSTAEEL